MEAQNRLHPIARVGRYRVLRLLGRGGTSAVYEVSLDALGRRFALKRLLSPTARTVARLEREARALARLHHPHIVAPIDFGTEENEPYLVMELVVGEPLSERLARAGRLDLRQVAATLLPVCSAIEAAHSLGIVHRDLKPSNVMLADGPGARAIPKVVDFGLARSMAGGEGTLTGQEILGTIGYLSPEAARGHHDLGPESDVYALGVMLFECATGRRPFVGASSYEVMHAIVTGAYPRPSRVVSELPASFDELVAGTLATDRSKRWNSAAAVGRALLPYADAGTRALWEAEFDGQARLAAPLADDATRSGETMSDQPLVALGVAVGEARARPASTRWRQAAAWVPLGVLGAFALGLATLDSKPAAFGPAGRGAVTPMALPSATSHVGPSGPPSALAVADPSVAAMAAARHASPEPGVGSASQPASPEPGVGSVSQPASPAPGIGSAAPQPASSEPSLPAAPLRPARVEPAGTVAISAARFPAARNANTRTPASDTEPTAPPARRHSPSPAKLELGANEAPILE